MLLWALLFWGGACLPPMTGIFIDAAPAKLKPLASSISMVIAPASVCVQLLRVGHPSIEMSIGNCWHSLFQRWWLPHQLSPIFHCDLT